MPKVLDLYETIEILESRDYNIEQIGQIFVSAISVIPTKHYLSRIIGANVDELNYKTEKKIKKRFLKEIRQQFYNVKNGKEIIPSDISNIESDRVSIEGVIKGILDSNGSIEKIGEAVKEGAKLYHKEKPSIFDGRYKIFREYNCILDTLRE